MSVPVLMITYNRLEYTKKAYAALMKCKDVFPFIIDNGSTDGTQRWLQDQGDEITMILSDTNHGIAPAMNVFLRDTKPYPVVGKIDNDTILPEDFIDRMLPFMEFADIIQAKHHVIKSVHPEGWEGFTRTMRAADGLLYNHYVGGAGILFKRPLVNKIPTTDWKLGGWRLFQKENPELIKAFVPSVEIELLDAHGYGDYPGYYKETGRSK